MVMVASASPACLLTSCVRVELEMVSEVFTPVLYAGTAVDGDSQLKLGRGTDWRETGGVTRGIGQKTYLLGDADRTVMELKEIEFAR